MRTVRMGRGMLVMSLRSVRANSSRSALKISCSHLSNAACSVSFSFSIKRSCVCAKRTVSGKMSKELSKGSVFSMGILRSSFLTSGSVGRASCASFPSLYSSFGGADFHAFHQRGYEYPMSTLRDTRSMRSG